VFTWPIEGKVAGSDIYFELFYNEIPGHWLTGTEASTRAVGVRNGYGLARAVPVLGRDASAHFKVVGWRAAQHGIYKQERNRVTGTVTAYTSSCVTKDVESAGGVGPARRHRRLTSSPDRHTRSRPSARLRPHSDHC